MRIIVSDTSPIRVLDHLGLLDLLPRLFTEIVIPPKVLNELEYPTKRFKPLQLASFNWIQVRTPANREQVTQLLQELDAGEAEAIALAIELQSEILIDEAEGREVAARLGLPLVGALGVLVRLKTQGLIGKVLPLIDRLQAELGFFISPELRAEIRQLAHE